MTNMKQEASCQNESKSPPDWVKSGVGRKAAVGERGERLWVGEPGRLSPDDSEWFREEKLRLVCRRGDGCMAKRLKRERRLEEGKVRKRKRNQSRLCLKFPVFKSLYKTFQAHSYK